MVASSLADVDFRCVALFLSSAACVPPPRAYCVRLPRTSPLSHRAVPDAMSTFTCTCMLQKTTLRQGLWGGSATSTIVEPNACAERRGGDGYETCRTIHESQAISVISWQT